MCKGVPIESSKNTTYITTAPCPLQPTTAQWCHRTIPRKASPCLMFQAYESLNSPWNFYASKILTTFIKNIPRAQVTRLSPLTQTSETDPRSRICWYTLANNNTFLQWLSPRLCQSLIHWPSQRPEEKRTKRQRDQVACSKFQVLMPANKCKKLLAKLITFTGKKIQFFGIRGNLIPCFLSVCQNQNPRNYVAAQPKTFSSNKPFTRKNRQKNSGLP